jgi:hypothetical protein
MTAENQVFRVAAYSVITLMPDHLLAPYRSYIIFIDFSVNSPTDIIDPNNRISVGA